MLGAPCEIIGSRSLDDFFAQLKVIVLSLVFKKHVIIRTQKVKRSAALQIHRKMDMVKSNFSKVIISTPKAH